VLRPLIHVGFCAAVRRSFAIPRQRKAVVKLSHLPCKFLRITFGRSSPGLHVDAYAGFTHTTTTATTTTTTTTHTHQEHTHTSTTHVCANMLFRTFALLCRRMTVIGVPRSELLADESLDSLLFANNQYLLAGTTRELD
jgi:hypothetical protein